MSNGDYEDLQDENTSNNADLVDVYSSSARPHAVPETSMSLELANQAASLLTASQPTRASSSTVQYIPHRQAPDSHLSNSEQLAILRDAYAKNPNPGKRDLEALAERTGRPWNKIREYFRQRRNKMRGLVDLENMEEPGRATSWLQVTYRAGPATSSVSQLNLYSSYKDRFDPYSSQTPLLGGQELIQLACATFPGCAMARDEGDYILKGMRERSGDGGEGEVWEKRLDTLVEPIRAGTWLLSNFQHPPDPSSSSNVTQTELYMSYANRFPSTLQDPAEDFSELRDFEANMSTPTPDADVSCPADQSMHHFNRLLNPVELITLARMTFSNCEPSVDEEGRFVIKGLERREATEKGQSGKTGEMFPFALTSDAQTNNPSQPFTSLLKRKLALLSSEADEAEPKKPKSESAHNSEETELSEEDREMLEGLKRFKGSKLGQEVREICASQ